MLLMKSLCNLIIKISPKGIPYLLNILKFPSKSTIYLLFVSSKNISNSISLISFLLISSLISYFLQNNLFSSNLI